MKIWQQIVSTPIAIVGSFITACSAIVLFSFALTAAHWTTIQRSTPADLIKAIGSFDEMSTLMRPVLTRYNASRIGVYYLHNDITALGSTAMFSVSVANVISQTGVVVKGATINTLPASVFAPVLLDLIDNKPSLIVTTDLSLVPLRQLLETRHVEAIVFVSINDSNDNMVGMLFMSWLLLADLPSGLDRIDLIGDMQVQAAKISKYYTGNSVVKR